MTYETDALPATEALYCDLASIIKLLTSINSKFGEKK